DHSGTVRWLLRAESCALELHTPSKCVCFEPKAHNRLCTTLNIALGSVVSRGRSASKHFPCPWDHSGTVRWLLRAESCALELHTPSKCVCFEPKAHNRLCTTLNIALGAVVSRGRSASKHFPCPRDHSGTVRWLLRAESCALELHTPSKCVF